MAKDSFHTHIQKALADANLQAALDANAERRLIARQKAQSSLPRPWEEMRSRAHAVRSIVIDHLDEYQAQFVERLKENGVTVLHAADGVEAVNFILDIAKQNGARRIAKSKTMVAEEIELNHALEGAGLEVVETDLGEYIVQLRGERPAHIITPAVHLQRADVGQTFHEKLGIPLTEDVPTLTHAARGVLRQVFLEADLGISGVNFGVAETGTLCIVSNEGNGRMVTTLPKVHIALMGIERLVPSMDDLALMLYLLARSSAGQKLTVYTNLIHSPRRTAGEAGPQQRYLILVDNGRSALRQSALREALMCIRCGACLNVCPVFREIGGHAYVGSSGKSVTYAGPIGSVISPGLFGREEFGQLARASSLCGACKEVCPVDIDLPKLLLRIRAGEDGMAKNPSQPEGSSAETPARPNAPRPLAYALALYSWVAASPRRFALAQSAAGVFSRVLSPISTWLRLPAFTGWGYSKDFPRPAAVPFRRRWKSLSQTDTTQVDAQTKPFDNTQPEVGSTARVEKTEVSALIERFGRELTSVGGVFIQCRESELAGCILGELSDRKIQAVSAWADERLPQGLLDQLREAGINIMHDADPSIRAGLTGANAAIAETGSLLVCNSLESPLTSSLLPEVHMAILHPEDFRESLPEVLNLHELREASAAVIITGPSRTADIEMTLTIGMHGPGEVIVFCISER
jgi:L-lactate dehydrogenase complex protein LldF